MISHHPSPDLLADSARGVLDPGATLVIAAHVYACSVCRAETELWESVGGALLQEEAASPLSPDALQKALARLNENEAEPARRRTLPRYLEAFSLPASLQVETFGNRIWVTPNIWFAPVGKRPSSEVRTYLVHAGPNTKLSLHTHTGRELTTVLHGTFRDDSGVFAKGDFAETDGAIIHSPTVTGDSDCLCLVSADAPMRLSSPIARAIQILTGSFY